MSQQVLVPHWRVLLGRLISLVHVFLRSCACTRGRFAFRDGVLMFSSSTRPWSSLSSVSYAGTSLHRARVLALAELFKGP